MDEKKEKSYPHFIHRIFTDLYPEYRIVIHMVIYKEYISLSELSTEKYYPLLLLLSLYILFNY